ncbi:MAG: DUF448 domain-containing protein [Candidatus Saccharimonadia bacterium]
MLERQCRVCRKRAPKSSLNRWVLSGAVLVLDEHKKLPGRGYYSCQGECSNKILSKPIRIKP